MPYRNGVYQFPPSSHAPDTVPSARYASFRELRHCFWQVLAHKHDRQPEAQAHWQARAEDVARRLRFYLGDHEAAAAIGAAAMGARKEFAQDLAQEGILSSFGAGQDWRARKGQEIGFR